MCVCFYFLEAWGWGGVKRERDGGKIRTMEVALVCGRIHDKKKNELVAQSQLKRKRQIRHTFSALVMMH